MKDNPIDPELQNLLATLTEHGRNKRRQQKLLAQIDQLAAEETRPHKKQRPLWWAAATGIAASMLLVLTIQPKQQPLVALNTDTSPLKRIQQSDSMAIKAINPSPLPLSSPTISTQAKANLAQPHSTTVSQPEPESNAEIEPEPTDNMTVTIPLTDELLADNLAEAPLETTSPAPDRPVIKTVRAILGTENQNTEPLRIKNETFAFNLALGPKEEEEMSQNSKIKPLIVNNL